MSSSASAQPLSDSAKVVAVFVECIDIVEEMSDLAKKTRKQWFEQAHARLCSYVHSSRIIGAPGIGVVSCDLERMVERLQQHSAEASEETIAEDELWLMKRFDLMRNAIENYLLKFEFTRELRDSANVDFKLYDLLDATFRTLHAKLRLLADTINSRIATRDVDVFAVLHVAELDDGKVLKLASTRRQQHESYRTEDEKRINSMRNTTLHVDLIWL